MGYLACQQLHAMQISGELQDLMPRNGQKFQAGLGSWMRCTTLTNFLPSSTVQPLNNSSWPCHLPEYATRPRPSESPADQDIAY